MFGPKRIPLEVRFWKYVDKREPDACWLWTGAVRETGYAQISDVATGRKALLDHRASWEIHFGPIPKGEGHHGTCVLHRCDNRICVNPNHLFLGTVVENCEDRHAKMRDAKGEGHGRAKITEEDVREIRRAHANDGAGLTELGLKFGILPAAVWKIVNQRTWRHVPNERIAA